MEYAALEVARVAPGLRLVLSKGVPGPWGEAAKAIFHVKGIPFTPVAHVPLQDNSAIREWTGIGNAPVAMFDAERPRSHWSEILMLAERLMPEPSLIPADMDERVAMFGLCHMICGEDGFGWNRRIVMFHIGDQRAARKGRDNTKNPEIVQLKQRYWTDTDITAVSGRLIKIVRHLAAVLHRQRKAGSPWFVGNNMTAADLYWAAFSNMMVPFDPELCPMPAFYRDINSDLSDEERAAIDPILIEHREHVVRDFFLLPMRF